jgi:hypothetical protein
VGLKSLSGWIAAALLRSCRLARKIFSRAIVSWW